jgi:hypothetical protein
MPRNQLVEALHTRFGYKPTSNASVSFQSCEPLRNCACEESLLSLIDVAALGISVASLKILGGGAYLGHPETYVHP